MESFFVYDEDKVSYLYSSIAGADRLLDRSAGALRPAL